MKYNHAKDFSSINPIDGMLVYERSESYIVFYHPGTVLEESPDSLVGQSQGKSGGRCERTE